MKVVVLHSEVSMGAGKDEEDVLIQVEAVTHALQDLGFEPLAVPCALNLQSVADRLKRIQPAFVFNLVETIGGTGRLIHIAPSVLDHLGIIYTGARTDALYLSSNKLLAKNLLHGAHIPTPKWFVPAGLENLEHLEGGRYIIKSVWEHASVGLDEDSVVFAEDPGFLLEEMKRRQERLGGDCFTEAYIEGREFNLSLLGGEKDPEVLPIAEIRFDGFPSDRVKVVGYRAKWEEESFEYLNTSRCFDFSREDAPLICRLEEMAKACWSLFGLRGYARVDFRVDPAGNPWVLEVNANPCLSPDAGFAAASVRAGMDYSQVVGKILQDSGIFLH